MSDTPQEIPVLKSKKQPASTNILTNFLIKKLLEGIISEEKYNNAAKNIKIIIRFRIQGVNIPELDELETRIVELLKSLPESEAAIENFYEICGKN